jgi:biopolymer transport protein ExbB
MGLSAVPAHSRLTTALLGFLSAVLLIALCMILAPSARAQDAEEGKAAETPKATSTADPVKQTSIFMHIVKSVGWTFGIILLLTSIALVALVVLLAMELRMSAAIPTGFIEEFTDTVNKRQFKQAYEMAKEDPSFLGRVMTTGMTRLQYGIEDAREAAFNMVESIKAGKEQLVAYLATIGTLGPMLGLVGTVWGMIMSFMELGRGGSPNPAKLADGISHALVVTLLGIGLSVPAIACHAFFRNRLIRIAMDTSNVADDLLTQMYHNSRRPAAPMPEPVPSTPDARNASVAVVKPGK